MSCINEAVAINEMFTNSNYDPEKFTASLFAPALMDERSVLKLKTENSLSYDCFYDEDDAVMNFFNDLLNIEIALDVFAFFPDGRIEKYHYSYGDFHAWADDMYQAANSQK